MPCGKSDASLTEEDFWEREPKSLSLQQDSEVTISPRLQHDRTRLSSKPFPTGGQQTAEGCFPSAPQARGSTLAERCLLCWHLRVSD